MGGAVSARHLTMLPAADDAWEGGLCLWIDDRSLGLPRRAGDRPVTRPNPHSQINQRPRWAAVERVFSAAAALPWVVSDTAMCGSVGTLALRVESHVAARDDTAFLTGREFAHFHPLPDGSLHLTLPPGVREEAIATGWAEPHPFADRGAISPLAVMVYAPRDEAEADVISRLVRASWELATG